MADTPPRKLAVILHADVAGSTTLVQKDESLAHERIRAAFQQLSKITCDYGGIAHEIRGDALVAEFSRASDSVCAALAFQAENTERNAKLDDEIRPGIRIGVSLGEVVVADGTLTGAGVVLAQRLEQLAEVGGVVVQGSVSETVPTRLPFSFDALGDKTLKGFDQPVRAFAARLRPNCSVPGPDPVAAIPEGPHEVKYSIAVLPFESTKEPEFSDGLSSDIITDLNRFGRFSVTAPHSSFAYKGKNVSVQQVAKELGVQYVLEGRVQWAGDRVRISVQLSDGITGQQTWAERYKRQAEDIFELQDELVEIISASLAHKLDAREASREATDDGHRMSAHDYYVKGREVFFARTRQSNLESKRLIEKAIELDENYARGYGFLAWLHVHDYRYGWSDNPQHSLDVALDTALKALNLDSSDYESHWRLGITYLHRRQFDKAMSEYAKARELNPNHAGFLVEMAGALILMGRPDDAIAQVKRAMRINPNYPEWFLAQLGWAYYESERYEEAFRSLDKMNDPSAVYLPLMVAALVELGRNDEARECALELCRREPTFTLATLSYWPYQNESGRARIAEDLRAAGIPE